MKRPRPLLFLFCLISATSFAYDRPLKYAVFTAPPYMIQADVAHGKPISGIDVEIVREIARQMQLTVEFIECPWIRCLTKMENGETDILSSAFKKPERERYMLYLDTPYLTRLPISFYFKKGSGHAVNKYEDLYRFQNIGVLKKASYFERFDTETRIKKYEVAHQAQLLKMLVAGHLEIVAGYVPTINYRIVTEGFKGEIEKSVYTVDEIAEVYIAISKKSPFANIIQDVNRINSALIANGFIQDLRKRYYDRYQITD